MVVVDRSSKYANFPALSHPFSVITVAQLYLDQVYKLHGSQKSIITDRDKDFISNFWTEFMSYWQYSLNYLVPITHKQMGNQMS